MSEQKFVTRLCGDPKATSVDVLFVHGLSGDAHKTWTDSRGTGHWPSWLCEDIGKLSVYTLGYPASILAKPAKKEMNLHERANNMLEQLAVQGIGVRPIVMVCHSLGGILVKEILRTTSECPDPDWKRIGTQVRIVFFLATPHTGSSLASVAKLLAPRITSSFTDLLSNEGGYLTNLNQSYRELVAECDISTVSYYEKHATKGLGVVVPETSADPGVSGSRPIPIDADHSEICKPLNRDDLVYSSICRRINKLVESLPPSHEHGGILTAFAADDYTERADFDRRDLLQKLMDAGREHEYSKANDLQNRFARRYYKLGLHTSAKAQSDAILAAVEQRFTTHVYNEKICKGASEEEVAWAVQAEVIDAISSGVDPNGPSAGAVLQALYFLTEQCFIQWDRP